MAMRKPSWRFPPAAGAAGLLIALAATAGAATFEIDKAHSNVAFRVRHMMVSYVNGHFDDFSGAFDYDPADPSAWRCEANIQAASINTGVEMRDKDLRSENYLDVADYPTIAFTSTAITKQPDGTYQLAGNLTIHGVTKPVLLTLGPSGQIKDPRGNLRAGFTAAGKISRKEFGLTYTKALETGGVVVGDEVVIQIDVEGVAKAAP
jgi:polyisoprenoid-binding protein YceI